MSDLDLTIARLRALPKTQQDALAARLDSDEGFTSHEEVVAAFRNRSA